MIADLRESSGAIDCDVCIVGAGPAGIALAKELGERGIDVVLLESGDRSFVAEAHDLNKGAVADPRVHGPLEEYRRRQLGGASTAWGGRCVPFDEEDFATRPHVPFSGWPIGRAELDPYYRRAHDALDLGAFTYKVSEALPAPSKDRAMVPGLSSDDVTTEYLYRFSPPTNVGKKLESWLAQARTVRVLLRATCLEVVTNAEGTAVTHLEVAAVEGAPRRVTARRFVLAAGGLEVTRLLLASQDPGGVAIGNRHDLLGRFYMCHFTHPLDVELASSDVVWDYERTIDGVYCQRTLAVRPERHRELGLFNHRARMEHPAIGNPDHRSGVLSAAYLAKSVLTELASHPLFSEKVSVLSRGTQNAPVVAPLAHVRNIVNDLPAVARFSRRWLMERVLAARKLPSIALLNVSNRYTLRIDAEQAPNPSSRVTLGDERDALGQRRLRVDWRYTDEDKRSVVEVAAWIGRALAQSHAGHAHVLTEAAPVATGGHHLGTTRMATDPRRGVVDKDCRVHGLRNLYVASGSVLPTASYANPTLTVVALALRLSDHLS